MRVVWTPLAIDRAAEAARSIAQDRPQVARRWVDALFDAAALLRQFPKRGRVVPEVGRPEIRELIFRKHRVVYRLEAKRIAILTVRHQRQQWVAEDV